MRILFDHPFPFVLAHGGVQIQIQQTKAALEAIGVEVEFLRWWDEKQSGDLIHFFGDANPAYLQQAQVQNKTVILTSYFSAACNQSASRLAGQSHLTRLALALPFGKGVKSQLKWQTFENCARNVVGLEAERGVLETVYRIPSENISVVPLGLSDAYLQAPKGARNESHLICTGTIRDVKYSVELAQMARIARCPILFVGKPYHPSDPYWLRFKNLIDGEWVKYHSHVNNDAEMIELLRAARGFVLMSDYENWSLSAHEAAACGSPLLLCDQRWARERFGNHVQYFKSLGVTRANINILREFYAAASGLPAPGINLQSWIQVAEQLKKIYGRVLNTSR